MTYNKLPLKIVSPFSGKELKLMPIGYPNEIQGMKIENHIYTNYDEGDVEWFDGPVAMYRESEELGSERLYYPLN